MPTSLLSDALGFSALVAVSPFAVALSAAPPPRRCRGGLLQLLTGSAPPHKACSCTPRTPRSPRLLAPPPLSICVCYVLVSMFFKEEFVAFVAEIRLFFRRVTRCMAFSHFVLSNIFSTL